MGSKAGLDHTWGRALRTSPEHSPKPLALGPKSAKASPRITSPYIAVPAEKVERQKAKIRRLKGEVAELGERVVLAEDKSAALSQANAELSRRVEELERVRGEAEGTRNLLKEREWEVRKLQEEKEGLRAKMTQVRAHQKAGEAHQEELESANQAWEASMRAVQAELVAVRAKSAELEASSKRRQEAVKALNTHCFFLLAKCNLERSRKEECEQRAEEAEAEQERVEKSAEQERTEAKATLAKALAQLDAAKLDHNRALAKTKEVADAQVASIELEWGGRQAGWESRGAAEKAEAAAKVALLQEEVRKAEEAAKVARAVAESSEERRLALVEQHGQLLHRCQTLEGHKALATREVEVLRERLEGAEASREASAAARQEMAERNQATLRELQEKSAALASAEREVQHYDSEVVPALRAEVGRLQEMVAHSHAQKVEVADSASQAHTRLRSALALQEQRYADAKRRIAELEDRIITLGSHPPPTSAPDYAAQHTDPYHAPRNGEGLRGSYEAVSRAGQFRDVPEISSQAGSWSASPPKAADERSKSPYASAMSGAWKIRSDDSSPTKWSGATAAAKTVSSALSRSQEWGKLGLAQGEGSPGRSARSVWDRVEQRCEEVRRAMEKASAAPPANLGQRY